MKIKEPTRRHKIPRSSKIPSSGKSWLTGWYYVVGGALLMFMILMMALEEDKVAKHNINQRKTTVVSETRVVTNSQGPHTTRANESLRTKQKIVERTPEHNLAILHEGWKVPEDHTTVFRFRYLLRQLDVQCIQSKQEIADMTVKAQQVIREKRGIKMNLLSMVEEMNETMKVYHPKGGGDYAELLAAEMILWMEGL